MMFDVPEKEIRDKGKELSRQIGVEVRIGVFIVVGRGSINEK